MPRPSALAALFLSASLSSAAPVTLQLRAPEHVSASDTSTPIDLTVEVEVGDLRSSPPRPLDLVFVLDVSGSMGGAKLERLKQACRLVLADLDPDRDRVSIVEFSDTARVRYPPAQRDGPVDPARIVDQLASGGGTNMVDGMRLGMRLLREGPQGRAVRRILLVGDGDANLGAGDMNRVSAWARDMDASVSTFAVGANAQVAVLKSIAEVSGGTAHDIEHAEHLPRIFRRELRDLREQAGDRAQLVVKPSFGLEFVRATGPESRLEAGPGVISLGDLVRGRTRKVRLRLRRARGTRPTGSGHIQACVSYRDEALGDGRQAHAVHGFEWRK